VRRLQQEAYEREIAGLRHDKEDLQRQVRALNEELRELRRAKEDNERDARSERVLLDSQLSEVNAMLRVKTAEYVQLSATYDDVSEGFAGNIVIFTASDIMAIYRVCLYLPQYCFLMTMFTYHFLSFIE